MLRAIYAGRGIGPDVGGRVRRALRLFLHSNGQPRFIHSTQVLSYTYAVEDLAEDPRDGRDARFLRNAEIAFIVGGYVARGRSRVCIFSPTFAVAASFC